MQLEVVREIARALSDTDDGVVAQLGTLPKDAGDTVTSDVLVIDGTSDDYVVKGDQIARGDAAIMLLVTPNGPTITRSGGVKGQFSLGTTPVAITVVHRGNRQPAQKVQDCAYVMRACVLVLKAYFDQREGGRVRNQVTVMQCNSVEYGLVADDGLGAVGAVMFNVDALDKRAQRTV